MDRNTLERNDETLRKLMQEEDTWREMRQGQIMSFIKQHGLSTNKIIEESMRFLPPVMQSDNVAVAYRRLKLKQVSDRRNAYLEKMHAVANNIPAYVLSRAFRGNFPPTGVKYMSEPIVYFDQSNERLRDSLFGYFGDFYENAAVPGQEPAIEQRYQQELADYLGAVDGTTAHYGPKRPEKFLLCYDGQNVLMNEYQGVSYNSEEYYNMLTFKVFMGNCIQQQNEMLKKAGFEFDNAGQLQLRNAWYLECGRFEHTVRFINKAFKEEYTLTPSMVGKDCLCMETKKGEETEMAIIKNKEAIEMISAAVNSKINVKMAKQNIQDAKIVKDYIKGKKR